MPYRVGVTGGIGSGKSAVTAQLQEHGITVVDADLIAREVVAPGSAAIDAIAEHFGSAVIAADGSLDRAALRRIVFAEPAQREWLEQLTHPLIRELIAQRLAAATPPYVVLSSPLLLETSQREFVDHVVVVDVPEALQVERTMARDANSEAQVRAIMAAQLGREERIAGADSVIDNSGDLAALREAVDGLHTRLQGLAAGAS
jgi:dephospho-CoA kinase